MRGTAGGRRPEAVPADPDPGRTRRRRAGSAPASLRAIALASGLEEAPSAARQRYALLRARAAWRHVVGAALGEISAPASLEGDRLGVTVRDARWKRELERHAPGILERLSALLPGPGVREIGFRVGPPPAPVAQAGKGGAAARTDPARGPAGPAEAADVASALEAVRERYLAAVRRRASG